MPKAVELLFLTTSSPFLVGVYEDGKLIDSISSSEKSSEALPDIYKNLDSIYDITALFYVNGPGSFMSIKITYIFLKSMSVLKTIPLYACDAFAFNENSPIKALGKLYFVKIAGKIRSQKMDSTTESIYSLPDLLNYNNFSHISEPYYGLGAVGEEE